MGSPSDRPLLSVMSHGAGDARVLALQQADVCEVERSKREQSR